MPTERLHLTDSLLLAFEARVIGPSAYEGKPTLVLDRTAFYAEAGGQLGDRGVLTAVGHSVAVHDVQVDDAGVVHHFIDGELPVGAVVSGTIDERHRRDSMSQHTGQHMLSKAFFDVGGLETVSARLGSETSTIDLKTPGLGADVIAQAVQRVNDAVLEDREIRVLFPSTDELAAMTLRKQPTVTEGIRIIEVANFDLTPCGGTHCHRTGQVGPVIVTGTEKYKGLTRVSFVAGARALRYLQGMDALVRDLGAALTCNPSEIAASIGRLREEVKTKAQLLGAVRAELARELVRGVLDRTPVDASGTTWLFLERDGEDIEMLRLLGSALAARADVVAVVSSVTRDSPDRLVVIDRGSVATVDGGKWLKALTTAHGGRGGGRPEHAEGKVPATVDWASVTAARG
jgi:alanyl-tRNA synthetase